MNLELMKNKILRLAVQGKLVSQNLNDKPAYCLIDEINEEREQLIAKKLMKKEKPLPEITDKEKLFDLPIGWEWVRLGDVGITNIGLTYKPSDISDSGVLVLRSSNIQKGKLDYKDTVYVNMDVPESKMCQKGDILICARNGSKSLVGKSALIDKDGMSFGAFMAIYRSRCNEYINVFLRSEFFRSQLGDANTVTINQITQNMLKNIVCPLPPLEEQKRIVKKVNKLTELIDELEMNKTGFLQTLENTRNKLFHLAMQGKLTKQYENDEPASILFEKIQKEREESINSKKMKKAMPLPTIEENEISHVLPSGWTWVRIGDIAQINPRNAIDDELEVGFVPMKLIEDGYSGKHTSETRQWKEVKKGFTHFQENDIAIAKITPCFENKKSAIMKDLTNGYGAGTTELHIVRPFHDYVLAEYLMCLFKSNTFIEKGVQTYTGTAGQQRVSKDFIENYVIGLPPLEEQKRIVEKVNKVWGIINEIERNIILVK